MAQRESRGNRVLAVIDIDQFSETIDAFGYRFGDRQLQALAGRLRANLPEDVHVARVGSDVFGVFGRSQAVNPAALRNILLAPLTAKGGCIPSRSRSASFMPMRSMPMVPNYSATRQSHSSAPSSPAPAMTPILHNLC